MNFYEQTSSCVSRLSPTEQNLFNYIIKNLHIVKDMSIRDLSEKCFVSTTSIFRLVKKLGYQGYAEFLRRSVIQGKNRERSICRASSPPTITATAI